MPHKDFSLKVPAWVDALEDPCLSSVVVEALVARDYAVKSGAEGHPKCAAALRSADTTLAMIRDGRVEGAPAWKKASDALRKYTVAFECSHPTATSGNPLRQAPPRRQARR